MIDALFADARALLHARIDDRCTVALAQARVDAEFNRRSVGQRIRYIIAAGEVERALQIVPRMIAQNNAEFAILRRYE